MSPGAERPPREGRRLLLRGLGAALAIMLLAGVATATAGLLELDTVAKKIAQQPEIRDEATGEAVKVDEAPPGEPQTILVLGSDRRWADLKKNNPLLARSNPARSDTIMLLRLDPDQDVTAVLSIPRDLKVLIPGHGYDKINAAYSAGGPSLTLKTLKALLGIKINHVINVNFEGFRKAIDALGCVYVDVDRKYYHSNEGLPTSLHYAEIDIPAGYQRLCGQKSLDYVRFRHADSDIVRAARQQDFLRAAKDQLSTSKLLGQRETLIEIFGKATQSDHALRTKGGLLKLVKLAIYSTGNPVREIPFPAIFSGDAATGQYVEASTPAIQSTVERFLNAKPASSPRGAEKLTRGAPDSTGTTTSTAVLADARTRGEDLVAPIVAKRRVAFPVLFPSKLTPRGQYPTQQPGLRVYTLRDRAGKTHTTYRFVVIESEIEGQYYGVQGTTWRTPPLLAHPTSTRVVDGRRFLLFRDGERLRYVAWKRKDAVYWVSNTLSLKLTNAQMIGIAGSLTRLGASPSK